MIGSEGNCNCAPSDIRAILEGYCLDNEFVTTGMLTFEEGSDVGVLQPGITLTGIMDFSMAQSSAFGNTDARVVSQDSTSFTFNIPAVETGDFEVNFVQYKAISDSWLANTRDCQVIPVVERMTGISFGGQKTVEEFHSGTGSTILILNHRPIVEVASINLITNPTNWVYVSPSSVAIVPGEGLLKLKAVLESWQNYVPAFPRGTNNILVNYTYGFDEVPCDVKRAVAMLTASQALAMIGARGGGGGINIQGYQRQYGVRGKYTDYRDELDRWADSLLRKYVMGFIGQ